MWTHGGGRVAISWVQWTKPSNSAARLWECYIDANNLWRIRMNGAGKLRLEVVSGGVSYYLDHPATIDVGAAYTADALLEGGYLSLTVNGVAAGAPVAYVEPVGTIPATMGLGHRYDGGFPQNAVIAYAQFTRADGVVTRLEFAGEITDATAAKYGRATYE